MTSRHTLIDTNYTLEIPEGVDLTVDLAGPVVRTLAFALDYLIRSAIFIVMMIVSLVLGGNVGWAVWLLVFFLLSWFYPIFFEMIRNGQTPGKKAMGIAVVNDDLTSVSFSSSLVRNLLRAADAMPLLYTFGFLVMGGSKHFQRLGDIAAGTLVVHVDKETIDQSTLSVEPVPPPVKLTEQEQRAFVEFALRQDQFSEARQQELADIVEPLLNQQGPNLVKQIRGIGAWLLGAR